MEIPSLARLEDQGVLMELRPGAVFSLLDAEKVWLVVEGKLDLFLVEVRDGEPAGTRHHVMRVEAGAPVFGFEKPRDGALGMIGCPAIGTKVISLDKKQLHPSSGTAIETAVSLIERWLEDSASALTGAPAPKEFKKLVPGAEFTIEGQPKAILPLNNVVWVRHLEGSSTLLGDAQMPPICEGGFFAVSRSAWCLCACETRLASFSTSNWMEVDPEWEGLRQYQEQLFSHLILTRTRRNAAEQLRLRTSGQADARIFQSALHQLAAPLRQVDDDEMPAAGGSLDPLIEACRLVCKAAGIEIPADIRPQEFIKKQYPVTAVALAARLRIRQVMLKGEWWKIESAPMVGFYSSQKGPIALVPGKGGYHLHNPTMQEDLPMDETLAAKLDGFAYVFYRSFPNKALNVFDILSFGLKGCTGDAATILLMGLAAGLMGIATPVLTGMIFDTVIPGAQRTTLAEFALFLVISAIATAFFTLTRNIATLRLQGRMEASVQPAVWDRLLGLPVPFFRKFTSGDLAQRSLGISLIRQALTESALSSILTGIFSLASCALMFYYSWRLALVACVLVFVSFLVSTLFGWIQVRFLRRVSEMGGRISGMTLQFINGIAKFRVSGTEARAFAVWAGAFSKQRALSIKARKIGNLVATFNSIFPVLAWAVIFSFSFAQMKTLGSPVLTTGEFLAFLAAFVQFSNGSLELSAAVTSVLTVVPLYERAKPILTALPEVNTSHADSRELHGSIDVHHVNFRYRDEGPLVLRDLSLSIAAGQFVALVGASGSGKSTIFRLLMGFETPANGAVYYDGHALAELDVQSVRRQIGVVLQNAQLSTGSIFRNIVGEGTLTLADAWEAARSAGLEEDLKNMPMGMHTVVSEAGGGLSGGQRQRLLIARAIVHKPRILLFDEATSALDNQTQSVVRQSLSHLNATRVVIAHRLSTVMQADRIHVIDEGSVVESGSYEELMAQGGTFTRLAKRQLS